MSLNEIFCQDRALRILQRGLAADRSAHAYIFAGPEGVGKYRTAREWARLLLCRNPRREKSKSSPWADSCGSCESCTLLEADAHSDYAHVYKELLEYTEDGKDKKTPVELAIDVIREFLIDRVSSRPALSERKVFVVSEAEKLNVSSQNALLKVLEEPPGYCTIILLCTRLEKLLPTIKSRCQIIRFGPIAEDRMIAHLAGMGRTPNEAAFLARLAQGSLGLACQWARLDCDGVGLFEMKREILVSFARCRLPDTPELIDKLQEETRQLASSWAEFDRATSKSDLTRRAQKTLLQILISALHDVTILHLAADRPLVNADQADQVAELARRLDAERAITGVAEGYEMLRWVEANVAERLIFERFLLRLARVAIMNAQCQERHVG
jgi:DNA polymerase-3 subunit delta'